jgi:hypothetical protein
MPWFCSACNTKNRGRKQHKLKVWKLGRNVPFSRPYSSVTSQSKWTGTDIAAGQIILIGVIWNGSSVIFVSHTCPPCWTEYLITRPWDRQTWSIHCLEIVTYSLSCINKSEKPQLHTKLPVSKAAVGEEWQLLLPSGGKQEPMQILPRNNTGFWDVWQHSLDCDVLSARVTDWLTDRQTT